MNRFLIKTKLNEGTIISFLLYKNEEKIINNDTIKKFEE